MVLMLVLVAVFVAGIAFWKYRTIKQGQAMGAKFAPPPAAVTTVVVQPQTWQPVLKAVGTLKAVNGVVISTDLAGIVSEIAFESGRPVKQGDLLVKLDTQQEEAQLRSTQAKLDLAKTDVERKRDLLAKKAIAEADWDTAQSQLQQMVAEVEEMKALAGRKRIAAPFDGMAGIRQVNVGQYLQPGSPIVPLQSLDPIYVEFALPQQRLETIEVGRKVRVSVGGIGITGLQGDVTAIDSKVDGSTRNILIQATLANPDHKLRPGMFADVELLLPETPGVLSIPTSSIAYAPYGDSVYVVRESKVEGAAPDGKEVQQQFVKLGTRRGDQVAVVSGLEKGDEIVTSGVFKLRPGAAVKVDNTIQPGNELNPNVTDS